MLYDRYVVSKRRRIRIPCDGPLTAQIERCKLEQLMLDAGEQPDVGIEYIKEVPRGRRISKRR
jgi:hypothetical protein